MSRTSLVTPLVIFLLTGVVALPRATAEDYSAAEDNSPLRLNAPRIELLPPLDQAAPSRLPKLGWPRNSHRAKSALSAPAISAETTVRFDFDDATPNAFDQATPATTPAPAPAGDGDDLSPELIQLRDRIRKVLTTYYNRPLDSRIHNPWEVMHGIIAYGCETPLLRGASNEKVNAVAYMCWNGDCGGDKMLFVNNGRVEARQGPRVQGHFGQYLAILAQSRVPIDYPMQVFGQNFTIADLIESEKLGCRTKTELTFKLIALTHYCDTDTTWKSDIGEEWSIPKLLKEEITSPIRGAACGGTHRLTGIAYTVYKRNKEGKPIDGEYLRAQKYMDEYENYALSLQNPDGSFSTEWFTRRADRDNDIERKLQTTGHILEWFAFSAEPEQLRDPRTIKTVNFLTRILDENPTRSWAIGPMGHALHALAIYDRRMFGNFSPAKAASPDVADKTPESAGSVGDD